MNIIRPFCIQSYIVLVALCLAACGPSASPFDAAPQPQPIPTQAVQRATSIALQQTRVPFILQSLTLGGERWTIEQPQGIKPMAAANSKGVLWVQFPPMETNATIQNYAMHSLPQGEYAIMYTPLRAGGGALNQGATRLLELPRVLEHRTISVTSLSAANQKHFLLSTHELQHNAQNGGTTRIRWIDPDASTIKEVVTAVEGGGAFLTTAKNEQWLFWNTYRLGDTNMYDSDARAGLLDLQSGQTEPVVLGEPNVALRAHWADDGMLAYTHGGDQQAMLLDPATKQTIHSTQQPSAGATYSPRTPQPTAIGETVELLNPTIEPVFSGAVGWEYERVLVVDLDGNGTEERVVTLADAFVEDGQPLWDDGHRWQVYVEQQDGSKTTLYRQFLQLGRLDVSVSEALAGQIPTVLMFEHLPGRFRIYESSYQASQIQSSLVFERVLNTSSGAR
ncbi:MAG: hypothetical protein H7Z42_22090 [Roseiflexaceae bacterium]|nr:hypothetical protein [Roseiflexaceae bacterium]